MVSSHLLRPLSTFLIAGGALLSHAGQAQADSRVDLRDFLYPAPGVVVEYKLGGSETNENSENWTRSGNATAMTIVGTLPANTELTTDIYRITSEVTLTSPVGSEERQFEETQWWEAGTEGIKLWREELLLQPSETVLSEAEYLSPPDLLPRILEFGEGTQGAVPFSVEGGSGSLSWTWTFGGLSTVVTEAGVFEALYSELRTTRTVTAGSLTYSESITDLIWHGRDVGILSRARTMTRHGTEGTRTASHQQSVTKVTPASSLGLPVEDLWSGETFVEGGYIWNPQLGFVYMLESPWVFIEQVEWAWVLGKSLDNLWVFIPGLGWHYTSEAVYPFYWSANLMVWLELVDVRTFRNVETGDMIGY